MFYFKIGKSSNLIDYSTDMCFSCACITRYIEFLKNNLSVFVCGEFSHSSDIFILKTGIFCHRFLVFFIYKTFVQKMMEILVFKERSPQSNPKKSIDTLLLM
jgi:hypothetical protein